MGDEPSPPWTAEQLASEEVSKKDIVQFLQENASHVFLQENKMKGQLKNVVKTSKKDQLIVVYNKLFESKAFKGSAEEEAAAVAESELAKVTEKTEKLTVDEGAKGDEVKEKPRYMKRIMKKGDKINIPQKGDNVKVWYVGKLQDGTVFDTNILTGKKKKSAQPLKFKVGTGKVIRGWDEAVLTMSSGEKAELTIEPEWAYGKKGLEGKIPPNSTLIFEVELAGIE